jgi:hypothetical protein
MNFERKTEEESVVAYYKVMPDILYGILRIRLETEIKLTCIISMEKDLYLI